MDDSGCSFMALLSLSANGGFRGFFAGSRLVAKGSKWSIPGRRS
jgi:hypothetical protein